MIEKDPINIKDKKRILLILALLSIIVILLEICFPKTHSTGFALNLITILLIAVSIILEHFSIQSTVRSFWTVAYLLILNILIGSYINLREIKESNVLGSILAIVVLIPASAFVIGKRQALYIGSILMAFIIILTVVTGNPYLTQNIYLLSFVIIAFSLSMYYLIYLLEERTKNEQRLLHELKTTNTDISFINSLALNMADFSADKDIIPFLLSNIKQHTQAKVAVFNLYDPLKKALIVKGIEADGVLLKTAVKIAGEKILNTSSPVSEDIYREILKEEIGTSNSLTELSFGAIPENIDKTLKNLTGITIFYAIAHIISGELYGTTFLAFKKNHPSLSSELLKSYAYLAAISLRRNVAENALKKSEANLRSITDNISDVVHIFDLNLNSTYVSPSITRLTGETCQAFMNRSMEEKHPQESLSKIRSLLTEEMEKEKDLHVDKNRSKVIELELLRPDGSSLFISTHLSFIRDEHGAPVAIQGVTRDITEIKEVNKQLESYAQELKILNADKDRFIQIIAHDLRNPFNTLLGVSDLLIENINKYHRSQIHDFIKTINQTAHRTYNLLEEILLWSKALSGKLPFEPEKLNFHEEFNDVILKMQSNVEQKTISLNVTANPDMYFTADKNMIRTILRNLVSNAIKFSRPEGKITISAEKNEDSVLISVSDNGVGIKEEDRIKLWDSTKPFTTHGTNNETGSGLGLIICKELVEKHKGKIWVESEVGKGSNFYITLPDAEIIQ
jgi:PAS domain S-box-containing protein